VPDLAFTFSAPLWLWQAPAATAWHFITLPDDIAAEIRFFKTGAPGFRQVRVTAAIGTTSWKTSIFPDKKSGSFLLPIKAEVRKAQNLRIGEKILVKLSV
jgi:Domain of unknown function (DUF1905)